VLSNDLCRSLEGRAINIHHSKSADDGTVLGRDVESLAFSRAVRWHVENRVRRTGIGRSSSTDPPHTESYSSP